MDERKTLNVLKAKVRFPIKEAINTPHKKCFVLIQSYVMGLGLEDNFNLRTQTETIVDKSWRVLQTLKSFCDHFGMGLT